MKTVVNIRTDSTKVSPESTLKPALAILLFKAVAEAEKGINVSPVFNDTFKACDWLSR
jgi:hypothetical protein